MIIEKEISIFKFNEYKKILVYKITHIQESNHGCLLIGTTHENNKFGEKAAYQALVSNVYQQQKPKCLFLEGALYTGSPFTIYENFQQSCVNQMHQKLLDKKTFNNLMQIGFDIYGLETCYTHRNILDAKKIKDIKKTDYPHIKELHYSTENWNKKIRGGYTNKKWAEIITPFAKAFPCYAVMGQGHIHYNAPKEEIYSLFYLLKKEYALNNIHCIYAHDFVFGSKYRLYYNPSIGNKY